MLRAAEGLDSEIIVADNASSDDSLRYLAPLFPSVHFIENTTNLGFARANNEAVKKCRGRYILFLNPDTLLPEDALRNSISYLKAHPKAGALGVRMTDGRGRFLAESKRSFPSPWVSFCKLSGLAALFPASKLFNRYALGYLDQHSNHVVDVLAGAYLLVRKDVFEQLKGFDETYFLYGEDIDLSYRIRQAGFENHYFAGTSIIHFKGESSAKEKAERDRFFYQAMHVFVTTYYSRGPRKFFSFLLKISIRLRSLFTAFKRVIRPFILPVTDTVLLILSLHIFRAAWISLYRNGKDFGVDAIPFIIPAISFCFTSAASFTGLYEPRFRMSRMFSSLVTGFVCMLAMYALLPEQLRFSRGVIVCGGLLGAALIWVSRLFLVQDKNTGPDAATVVVCSPEQYPVIYSILAKDGSEKQLLGRITPGNHHADAVGALDQLKGLVAAQHISRIIYCVNDLPWDALHRSLTAFTGYTPSFLFYTAGSQSIISSQASPSGAELVTPYMHYALAGNYQLRMKRVTDFFFAFIFLCLFPLHFLVHPHPVSFLKNCWQVLTGLQTWVGYEGTAEDLPVLPKAVISHRGTAAGNAHAADRSDRMYARHYDWWNDVRALFRYYQRLG